MGKCDVERHIKKGNAHTGVSYAKATKSRSTLTFQPASSSVSGQVVLVRPTFVELCVIAFYHCYDNIFKVMLAEVKVATMLVQNKSSHLSFVTSFQIVKLLRGMPQGKPKQRA